MVARDVPLVQFKKSGIDLLCDPWLVDKLTFASQTWFAEGTKPSLEKEAMDITAFTRDFDVLLLSQTLDDHTHRPTLRRMRKDILVVGSPEVANIVRDMGFTNIVAVDHNETKPILDGRMTVTGTVGALVGPPWSRRQHGFVLAEDGGVKVYYEPHASFRPESLQRVAPVDIVVTPTTSTYAAGYPLVEGLEGTPSIVRLLQPKVVVPLDNSTVRMKGVIAPAISTKGTNDPAPVETWLRKQGLGGVKVAGPQAVGQPVDIVV